MPKTIKIKVTPRSSQSAIIGWQGDVLKVKLNSPPVEGKANEELIKLLSKYFKTAKSNIEIIKGENGREKTVAIK